MTTLYLIRHSLKYKKYQTYETNEEFQIRNEKKILSCEGERLAMKLSENSELQNIDEIWSSSYVRAIATAKYICESNNLELNVSRNFDARHYGDITEIIDKEQFWINQFLDADLKLTNGESQNDVRRRMDKGITTLLENSLDKRIVIVTHNASILFYLLKYCSLDKAVLNKKLTIRFGNKVLINEGILKSPSIVKLNFDEKKLVDISYIDIN